MKLVRLSLHHFRQHLDTAIQFSEGITGIIGPNGSGKTTLVEALYFALYGARALRGRVEDLKPRNMRGEGRPLVQLLFEHDGASYRIERGISDAKLFLGGEDKPLALGNREVTQRITGILGMSQEEFVAAYFTEQNGLEFLGGKSGAAERERFIVRMLGYDRLESIQDLLREDRRDKRQELLGLQSGLGAREELELEIAKYTQDSKSLEALENEATEFLRRAERETAELKRTLATLQEKSSRYSKERENLGLLQVRYDEKVKRIKILEKEKKHLLGQVQENEALKEALKKHSFDQYRNEIRQNLKVVTEDFEVVTQNLDALSRQRTEERIALKHEKELWAERYRELGSKKQQFEGLGSKGECPTCGQELGRAFESVRLGIEQEYHAAHLDIEGVDAKISSLDNGTQELLALKERLFNLDQAKQKLQKLLEVASSFDKQFGDLARVEGEVAALRQELSELDLELKSIRDKISAIQFVEEDFLKVQGAYDAAQRLIEVYRLKKVKLQGELDTKRALRERTTAALLQYDQKVRYLNEQKGRLLLYDEGDKLLTDFRRYVNASIRPRLSEIASEFIADLTDGRYTNVEVGEDYAPTVVEDGDPKPVISGGEQDILNLCLRLSLSQMLTERSGAPFALLILDEVFGSLDEGRRANVLSLLEKLGSRFEQTIIITHLDDIKEGVEHLVAVEYDEGSGVSIIGNMFPEEQAVFNL